MKLQQAQISMTRDKLDQRASDLRDLQEHTHNLTATVKTMRNNLTTAMADIETHQNNKLDITASDLIQNKVKDSLKKVKI